MRKQMMLFSLAVSILMLLISAWAWRVLPAGASIPVHWNVAGEVDRYGGKAEGLLLLPGITMAVSLLFYFLPSLDPKGNNLLRSEQAFRAIWAVMLLFFVVIHVVMLMISLGKQLNMGQIILSSVSILFMVMGNYMGKIRQNYTMGIRTPWTLHNEQIWNKTHRLGGWLFVLCGLISLLVSLLFPSIGVYVLPAMIASASLIPIFYSYLLYRKEQNMLDLP